jgi:hypothetical protein
MSTDTRKNYWLSAGLERRRPALLPSRHREVAGRIAAALRVASWSWMVGAAIYAMAGLDSLSTEPWDSLWVVALVVGPATAGILLSLLLDALVRNERIQ